MFFRFVIVTSIIVSFFFFNDTATTEIYPLSLHDALPISRAERRPCHLGQDDLDREDGRLLLLVRLEPDLLEPAFHARVGRSEEHTSELQSQSNLVCRLLLEKKKKISTIPQCRSYTSVTRI